MGTQCFQIIPLFKRSTKKTCWIYWFFIFGKVDRLFLVESSHSVLVMKNEKKEEEEKTCNPAVCALIEHFKDCFLFIYSFFLIYITHTRKITKKTI